MPLYDCGDPDCDECRATFPDRVRAIHLFRQREVEYRRIADERNTKQAAE